MDLTELAQLIQIRQYIVKAVDNFNLERDTNRTLAEMLPCLDKKIVALLHDTEFKSYIQYTDKK